MPKITSSWPAGPGGALPQGVTFVDNGNGTATLGVTPGVAIGTYQLTITASNGIVPDATKLFTLIIIDLPGIVFPDGTPSFTVGAARTFRVNAANLANKPNLTE